MIEYKVQVYKGWTEWRNQNEELHRLDGPALEYSNGYKSWWVNGKRHRLDGPAIEWVNGDRYWYINGIQYSEDDFNKKIREINKSCDGKIIEVDGKKYKLVEVS